MDGICGEDLCPSLAAKSYDQDLWPGPVVQTCGQMVSRDLWPGAAGGTCGLTDACTNDIKTKRSTAKESKEEL